MEKISYFQTELAGEIWARKYSGDYTDPQQYYNDLAERVSLGSKAYQERFLDILTNFRFSPGGRILAWAGRPSANMSLMNCTTHAVEDDDLDAIAETMRIIMRASSHGQGIGIDLSKLRPQEAPVHNAAKSSTGALSFMELMNHVGGTIGQNGRRAALLFSMKDSPPDLWRDAIDVVCQKCQGKGCFMRVGPIFLLSTLLLLSACTGIGPEKVTRDRFDYVTSISESWKRQMLLNMLKVRYSDAGLHGRCVGDQRIRADG